ncbi:MAG: hypothetical protein WCG97_01535 [bacterium]
MAKFVVVRDGVEGLRRVGMGALQVARVPQSRFGPPPLFVKSLFQLEIDDPTALCFEHVELPPSLAGFAAANRFRTRISLAAIARRTPNDLDLNRDCIVNGLRAVSETMNLDTITMGCLEFAVIVGNKHFIQRLRIESGTKLNPNHLALCRFEDGCHCMKICLGEGGEKPTVVRDLGLLDTVRVNDACGFVTCELILKDERKRKV